MKKILTSIALCSSMIFATGCGYNVATPYAGVGYGSGVSVGVSSGYYPRYGYGSRYGVGVRYRSDIRHDRRMMRRAYRY